jgi:hypothetical protein
MTEGKARSAPCRLERVAESGPRSRRVSWCPAPSLHGDGMASSRTPESTNRRQIRTIRRERRDSLAK